MSTYVKTKADQKAKMKSTYNDKLFSAASLVLPAVVARSGDDVSPAEMVDEAILLARDLLAALNYKYPGMKGAKDEAE